MNDSVRLLLALAAYGALGLAAWHTMAADRMRLVTLMLLGLFAVKTFLAYSRRRNEARRAEPGGD